MARASHALRRRQQDAQCLLGACKPYKSLPLTSPGHWFVSRAGTAVQTMSSGATLGSPPAFAVGIFPPLMQIAGSPTASAPLQPHLQPVEDGF